MKRLILIIMLLAALSVSAQDQDTTVPLPFTFADPIPYVRLNHEAVELQRALYPGHYAEYNARSDLRWAAQSDDSLESFWLTQGDTVLHILTELSGIAWTESAFDMYILRYFPSIGSPEPLVIPVGGMRRGEVIEAAPVGKVMKLNVIYQLARRMLDQANESTNQPGLVYHPLMRPGAYRRDNLALVLAAATAAYVLGPDSAHDAVNSAFWRQHFPGIRIYESHFSGNDWTLSPERTLASRVLAESPTSALVAATRPPRRPDPSMQRAQTFVEGLPLKGDLGMAISIADNGLLRVDALDPMRAAFAAGLQEGDLIRTVDNRRVQTHRELVERILETMYDRGAVLQIMRDGAVHTLVLRPVTAAPLEELGEEE